MKSTKKYQVKTNNGITLIALVITFKRHGSTAGYKLFFLFIKNFISFSLHSKGTHSNKSNFFQTTSPKKRI